MKKLLLLFSFLAIAFLSHSQVPVIFQGQVTDQATGNGVPNQLIFIFSDSTNPAYFYFNTVFTDSQGFYSDATTVPPGSQILFYVYAQDCNGIPLMQSGVSTNSPIIANFSICTGGQQPCTNYFTASPNGLTVNFAGGASSTNPVTYDWSFGDGTTGSGQNVTHTYSQPGNYVVVLTTFDSIQACVATSTQPVSVGNTSPCQAVFFAYPDSGTLTQPFYFLNASTGNNLSYSWNFGDGNTSTQTSPQHTYTQAGTYQVCLTISDTSGCQSTYCDSIIVTPALQCLSSFTFAVPSGLAVPFINQSFGAAPLNYFWTFGDGNTSTLANPVHTYASTGLYSISLDITDSTGCQSSSTIVTFVADLSACSANISFQVNGNSVDFLATGSGTPPFNYSWDFGDSTSGTGASLTHTYISNGTYLVSLIMTDSMGCTSITAQPITIGAAGNLQITGQITANNLPAGQTEVFLLGYSPSNGMIAMDTATTDQSGNYQFGGLSQGVYTLLAEPLPSSPLYMMYAPTYYNNAMHWGNAGSIALGVPANPYNINLLPIPGPGSGPAQAGGTVSYGGNKSGGFKGAPVPDVTIMLKHSGQMLDMRYSTTNGQFDFSDIPYGTYEIYAEVPGLPTIPATITLSQSNPTVNNISIIVMGSGVFTNIPTAKIIREMKIYPNPATDRLFFENPLRESGMLEWELRGIDGRLVRSGSYNTSGLDQVQIDLNGLSDGMHILTLNDSQGNSTHKKVIIR